MRTPRRFLTGAIVAALTLTGCHPSLRPPALVAPVQTPTASHEATALWGQVVAGYGTQATAAQLVAYATVTLLDASNQVVATGLTDASGAFSLNPFVSWTPTTNAVYVLDALKSFDQTNDRAGLRFRTLVSWDGSQWRSISGTTASASGGAGIRLSAQTTAIASIQSLRAIAASSLLGTLDPVTGAFTETGGITAAVLSTVTGLVNQALGANLDPVGLLAYSSADGTYRLALNGGSGRVLFDMEDALGNSLNTRTMVKGHDGGAAYGVGSAAGLYMSQFGASGSIASTLNHPMGVDVDRFGNVYVAEHDNHRISKFAPDGRVLWTLGASGSLSGQFQYPTDVSVDQSGNLLVTDYLNHRLQKFDAFGNLLFGIGGGARWTGAAPAWSNVISSGHNFLYNPHYAKFDSAGNIWVGDTLHHRMLKYDPNGNFLLGIGAGTKWTTTYQPNSLRGNTAANYTESFLWGNQALVRETDAIATDGNYFYVHDGHATNGGFYKIDLSGGQVAGPGPTPYLGSIRGSMAAVNKRLYYRGSGTGANKIIVLDPATMGEIGYMLQNGTGTIASANNDAHPWGTTFGWMNYGLTTDGRYLYIPEDTGPGTTFLIRVYDPFNNMAWVRDISCAVPAGTMNFDHHGYYTNGEYFVVCGYIEPTLSLPRNYRFRLSDGVYLGIEDGHDPFTANLTPACYDYVRQRILRQEHSSGRFAAYSNEWSGNANGWFNTLTGFAVSPNGELFVVDRANHRIQRFDPSGTYVSQWGTQGTGSGQFDQPEDAAIDNAGNLWVSDGWGANHRVQKFDRTGTYLTQLGTPGTGNGQFDRPRGLAFAPDGTLVVGDWMNNRVQRFLPTTTQLVSPAYGSFNAARGTLSFWFKPTWNGSETATRVFFRENGGNFNNLGFHKIGTQFYLYMIDNIADASRAVRVGMGPSDTAQIKAGEWHHLAATWDTAAGQYHFYFNGREYRSYVTNGTLVLNMGPSGTFYVGSEANGTSMVDSALDDFRLHDYPKSAEEILRDYRGLVQE